MSTLDWTTILDKTEGESSDIAYRDILEDYLDDVEMYDPKIGNQYRVKRLLNQGKNLYAVLKNDYRVELNISQEMDFFKTIFGLTKDLNVTDLLNTIEYNEEVINSIFQDRTFNVIVTNKHKDNLQGSIKSAYLEDLRNQLFRDIREEENVYECKILSKNGGGLIGTINGISVFIPGSHVSHTRVVDFDVYIGKTVKVMIDSYLKDNDMFVGSNKKYVNKILPNLLESLDKNTLYTGTVTGVSDYGVFVNFAEYFVALFHETEMSEEIYNSFKNKEINFGDEISFYIKSIQNSKIVVSSRNSETIRQENEAIGKRIVGNTYEGTVSHVFSAGYILEFEDEGQKHKGFIRNKEADKYKRDSISIGDKLNVYVDVMDYDTQKIYLSADTTKQ